MDASLEVVHDNSTTSFQRIDWPLGTTDDVMSRNPSYNPATLSHPIIHNSRYEAPVSVTPASVLGSLLKKGPDWFAVHNPRFPGGKSLEISVLHQFNHESVVCSVRFSKDGRYLATGCNRSAQIFEMKSGALVCKLEDNSVKGEGSMYIRSVCFSPDGKYLATGAEDHLIRVSPIFLQISLLLLTRQ